MVEVEFLEQLGHKLSEYFGFRIMPKKLYKLKQKQRIKNLNTMSIKSLGLPPISMNLLPRILCKS